MSQLICTPAGVRQLLFTMTAGIAMVTSVVAGPPKLVTTVEGIHEYQLDNGCRVLLFPDASKPLVTVNLTVFVGSRHEGYGEAGMAHLLEHMLFKGTPDHPDVPKVLKAHGADFNGTTWLDRTNYFETLPASAENVEFALRLEADRMINSFVRREDLDSEMTVVRNEFERGENSPSRVLSQRMTSAAFDWHNYGKSTIGNRADIERVSIDSLREFYRKYYQPDNAMVIVAGDFDPEQVLNVIQETFGAIPRPERVLPQTYTEEPAQDGERLVTLRRVGDVAQCGALYHIPAGAHPDYVSLDVLEHILTATPSGRLYKSLVETKRAASVSGAAYSVHDPGMFRVMAEVSPGNDPKDVLSSMLETLENLGEDGVTETEVERAKRYWLKNWEISLSDTAKLAVQLSEWAAQGDWRLMFLYRDRLEQVTVDSVNDVAKKYLQRNNRTAGLFIPAETAERVQIPETPNLAKMFEGYTGREGVAAGEAFVVTPENIESRTTRGELPGGVKFALLPKKTRGRTVHLKLTLRYGDAESLKGLETACDLLPSLMVRGTKTLTREQIQDTLDANNARMSASGGLGEATFVIETRSQNLPAVLDLLRQVLREPSLTEEQLGVLKNANITALEQKRTDPTELARVAVSRTLSPYPQGDVRYVPSVEESIERWKAIEHPVVARLYAEFLSGQHGEVAIVGDFDVTAVQPLMAALVADWTTATNYARVERTGKVDQQGEHIVIETPDKENATYLAGMVLPLNDASADYPALLMGNYVLGSSGLSSRLGDRVRQKEGLSYGVGSFLRASSIDERSTLLLYAITNPTNMPKVEVAIREEFEKLVADGVTTEELDRARDGYLQNLIVERSEDSELASLLTSTLETGRSMAYYADLEEKLSKLQTEDVAKALKQHFSFDRVNVVVGGDFKKGAQAAPAEEASK
ncbi:MAG: pitrilysin family protein [Planctomycetaceae bacterium]